LAEGNEETQAVMADIASTRFDIDCQYETLKSRFESDYPQYYKAKYDLTTIPLQEVQSELLQPNQSLLEYFVGDSSIFAFLVRKDTFMVKEIKHDFPLDKWVKDMTKNGIYGDPSKPTNNNETITNYTHAAYQLYEKIVAPVAGQLTEQVIVVPDGVLSYVPFEALLTQKPPREGAFSTYPFMLREHQISYCYSATLLKEMQQKQHRQKPSGEALALAPFYHGNVPELVSRIDKMSLLTLRDTLGSLKASGEEVAIVAKLMNGEAKYGGQSSLEQFKEAASSYRILHLSTHGVASDQTGDYVYLAFAVPGDSTAYDKLYARDLYNYQLNADMVVLSACETGSGKLRRGEGIISLARAFAYAGAKSIFPTLWQVSDAKTAELMKLFYKNLKMGMSKDAALRKAKLDFIADKKLGNPHPFYWAGMIGIGDMAPITH
jgi:CHAT domain-containing protein